MRRSGVRSPFAPLIHRGFWGGAYPQYPLPSLVRAERRTRRRRAAEGRASERRARGRAAERRASTARAAFRAGLPFRAAVRALDTIQVVRRRLAGGVRREERSSVSRGPFLVEPILSLAEELAFGGFAHLVVRTAPSEVGRADRLGVAGMRAATHGCQARQKNEAREFHGDLPPMQTAPGMPQREFRPRNGIFLPEAWRLGAPRRVPTPPPAPT
jgi:hypothetical protein